MSSYHRRLSRISEVKGRAKRPNHMHSYCRVIGCHKPARAGTADGLDTYYCRSHADHYQRHGSPIQGSFTAKELNPYRMAALEWVSANEGDPWVRRAILGVEGLLRQAGPHEEAFRLRGKSPRERASVAWARLRKHGVDPRLPVAAWLAFEMILRDDPQSVSSGEYKRVQAAKVVHRMASGTHKRWTREVPDPAWSGLRTRTVVEELHAYPKSRGRVLRHIGEDLERAVELLVEHHLEDVRAFKRERDAQGRSSRRAYPKRFVTRRRK